MAKRNIGLFTVLASVHSSAERSLLVVVLPLSHSYESPADFLLAPSHPGMRKNVAENHYLSLAKSLRAFEFETIGLGGIFYLKPGKWRTYIVEKDKRIETISDLCMDQEMTYRNFRISISWLHRNMWTSLQEPWWWGPQRMIFDLCERDGCFGNLDLLASPTVEEQITSSDQTESQKWSQNDCKNTASCQPVPNRQVSRDFERY